MLFAVGQAQGQRAVAGHMLPQKLQTARQRLPSQRHPLHIEELPLQRLRRLAPWDAMQVLDQRKTESAPGMHPA